ncbi:hypothetical protein [Corynebacterium pseudopelargi]|nr:hypothetical protein [Corynebacterium pseudopelargi]
MSIASIHFDVLAPEQAAELLPQRFDALSALLMKKGMIERAEVELSIPDNALETELRAVYLETYEELPPVDPESMRVYRLSLKVDTNSSLNQVAMLYSRLLTPPAALPNDPLALAKEEQFEQPAPYPWFLNIEAKR